MQLHSLGNIQIHQVLHGYNDGHSLISSSKPLSSEIERTMLVLSDMSGPSMIRGFETYLTAYPLKDNATYAFARTWYAPEMNRPGCVWTHTLLIDYSDLARIKNLRVLLELLARPTTKQPENQYKHRVSVSAEFLDNSVIHPPKTGSNIAPQIIEALYETPDKPVYIAARNASEYEDLIMAVWSQQWPRLRRAFAFCTGSIANRRLNGRLFDLQVIPLESFGQTKREVQFAVFLDPGISRGSQIHTHWVLDATDDLFHVSESALRRFIWNLGAEVPEGRSSYAPLMEIFDATQTVTTGQTQLEDLVDRVCQRFPDAQQAMNVKAALFGRSRSELDWPLSTVQEKEMLKALCKTPRYSALDPDSLSIRQRAKELWRRSLADAKQVIMDLVNSGLTPLGKEFITGISEVISPSEAIDLSNTNRDLFRIFLQHNPGLATSSETWQISPNEQLDLFDTVLSRLDLTESVARGIVLAMLDSGSDVVAANVANRFGKTAVSAILDWLNSPSRSSAANLGEGWKRALKSRPVDALNWVCSCDRPSNPTLATLASLLDPNSDQVIAMGAKIWLPLVRTGFDYVGRNSTTDIQVMTFVLALGFHNPEHGASELVMHSFRIVYDAAESERLEYSSWRLLKDYLPELSWWQQWDKCERLRLALIDNFIQYGWPYEHFLKAAERPNLFDKVLSSGLTDKRRREYIRVIARQVRDGKVPATTHQRGALASY